MELIKFDKKDLLSFEEIEQLIISVRPNQKAQIISSKLLNYLLINNGNFYRFDIEKVLYIKEDNNDDYILTLITLFIDKSYENLNQKDQEIIQLKYKKTYDKIFLNSDVNKYLPQLLTYLTNNKVDFSDPHLFEIHFLNGFYNFKTGKFEKREVKKHFINVHINREFTPAVKEDIAKVYKDINKIYPNIDDRNYLLMTLGQAITGQACAEQTMLFLLGLGSTGKSTILELCKLVLQDYVFTLPKQTFSKGYSKIDKILNTYMMRPYIRLSHINEPEDTKIDESLFKDHCDGKIQTTTLYADGSNDFQHYSKMVFTANTLPNIKIDSGSVRRVDAFNHTSKFTKEPKEVNESSHVYLANKDFLIQRENDIKYLNAFFCILAEFGFNWLTKTNIFKQTDNFRNTKDAIVSSNDIIQDFIDQHITITKKDSDRISRDDMFETFKANFPKSLITPTQLLNSLKQKDIIYNADYRLNKLKGCYVGVVFGTKEEISPLDYGFGKQSHTAEPDYKKLFEEAQLKIKDLESQLKPPSIADTKPNEYDLWYSKLNEDEKYEEDMKKYHDFCKGVSANGDWDNPNVKWPPKPQKPITTDDVEQDDLDAFLEMIEKPIIKKNKKNKKI